MASVMLYWKVLPGKNSVCSPRIDFPLQNGSSRKSAFWERYSPSVKELRPIGYKYYSFILDILMSKSNFFSLKNSLNIFTKFLQLAYFVLHGLHCRTQSHTSKPSRAILRHHEIAILVNWDPEVTKVLVHGV